MPVSPIRIHSAVAQIRKKEHDIGFAPLFFHGVDGPDDYLGRIQQDSGPARQRDLCRKLNAIAHIGSHTLAPPAEQSPVGTLESAIRLSIRFCLPGISSSAYLLPTPFIALDAEK